jgi:hypothetical protein
MRFLLQQGWGMMALNEELVGGGVGSGVILSPRVCSPDQITRHARTVRELQGAVLFDPQFYIPRTAHERILEFPYWQGLDFDTNTFEEGQAAEFCRRVIDYQRDVLALQEILLPGAYTNTADERWRSWQATFAEVASQYSSDTKLYSTVAIGPDVVKSSAQFDTMLDELVNYPVAGVYFVLRPPTSSFLIADEDYIYALLDGLLSVRLAGKDLIIGYANQQALLFAAIGATTIASGNFRNVRSFNPDIFDEQEEEERQRALWYYDGGTMSEFRIQTLQLAYRRGLRGQFGPTCPYCSRLLEADDLALLSWGEPDAFRHFLFELNRQWLTFQSVAPNLRLPEVRNFLTEARARCRTIRERGVLLGERSFEPYFEPSLAALEAIRIDRGTSLAELG